MKKQLAEEQVRVSDLDEQKRNLETQVHQKDSSLIEVQRQLSESETSCQELSKKVSELTSTIDSVEKTLNEKVSELSSTEESVRQSKIELDRISTEMNDVMSKNKDFLTTIEENIKTISILGDEKNDLATQLESKNSMLVMIVKNSLK